MKRVCYIIQRTAMVVCLIALHFSLKAQDIHFSQITRTQFLTNPAFTGTFRGDFRATLNWKDQWQSINNTFRTYAASAEYSFGKGDPRRSTFYAFGLHASKDVSGDVELGTSYLGTSFNALVRLSRNARFTVGVQGAYGKSGVNSASMQWGSQYNGLNFDPTLYNGEGIEYLPAQYWDLSAGVGYWYHKNDVNVVSVAPQDGRIGLAAYHVNRPDNSFLVVGQSQLPIKWVFHAAALYGTPVNELYWYPNLTMSLQGNHHQIFGGALLKYQFSRGSKMTGSGSELALSGGINMRVTNVLDAIVPQIFIDLNKFSIGMSYDINVSNLHVGSNYRGGFELSIRFTNPDGYTHRNPYRRGVSI